MRYMKVIRDPPEILVLILKGKEDLQGPSSIGKIIL
jgi:hypothetical protein